MRMSHHSEKKNACISKRMDHKTMLNKKGKLKKLLRHFLLLNFQNSKQNYIIYKYLYIYCVYKEFLNE